ncbi:MAG: hypothetical protein WD336_09350 [Trueperaceae bacterium]
MPTAAPTPAGPPPDSARREPAPHEPTPQRTAPQDHVPRALPQHAIHRLAERDAVRQWVWIPDGGAAQGRGSGPDPDRVAGEVRSLIGVLDRSGPVRTVHVRHGQGQVLIERHRNDVLLVAGDPRMNVGAIRTTFRALEEEP